MAAIAGKDMMSSSSTMTAAYNNDKMYVPVNLINNNSNRHLIKMSPRTPLQMINQAPKYWYGNKSTIRSTHGSTSYKTPVMNTTK